MVAERVLKDVMSQYNKPELMRVVEEAGLELPTSLRAKDVIRAIIAHLHTIDLGNASDVVLEFAVTAEIINAAGEYLEEVSEEVENTGQEIIADLADELPRCWGKADLERKDPACARCKIFEYCSDRRLKIRPACFGKLFDLREPECQACLEAPYCKIQREKDQV